MFHVDSKRPSVTIAAFTHGTFNTKKRKKVKFESFKRDDAEKKERYLVARTDTCCYVGKNFENMFSSSKMCRNYVGILNKLTGKIQICDADLFHLNPNFPDVEHKREENPNLSQFEKRSRLIEAFGGEKSKRHIENQHKNVVQGEVLKEAIDGALKETMKPENSSAIKIRASIDDGAISDLLPPCNIHAASVYDVYNLDDIISPADMVRLIDYSQEIFYVKREEISDLTRQEKYCQFVLAHLMNLPEDTVERQRLANCLMYFQYLVTLHQIKPADLKSKEVLKSFPDFVRRSFIDCGFITETRNYRGGFERKSSAYQKDKIAVYMIVLALLLDDFKTPVRRIMQDIKMGRVKMLKLFGYVGCKITQEKAQSDLVKNCAILKVPLQLKVVTRKRTRNS